jgi:hypothetical protein
MSKVGTNGLNGFQEAVANRNVPNTYDVDHVVDRTQGIAVYGRLWQQQKARQAVSKGMTNLQLAAWTREQKKEQTQELADLDCEGAKELIVHVASSTLEPYKAFREVYPQLGWSKFAANTTVQKLVKIKKVVEGKFRSYPAVTQLLSEAKAQSKGK